MIILQVQHSLVPIYIIKLYMNNLLSFVVNLFWPLFTLYSRVHD